MTRESEVEVRSDAPRERVERIGAVTVVGVQTQLRAPRASARRSSSLARDVTRIIQLVSSNGRGSTVDDEPGRR